MADDSKSIGEVSSANGQLASPSPASSLQSEGASSHHGTPFNGVARSTPGTKLSDHSPEGVRPDSKAIANSGIKVSQPPAFTLLGTGPSLPNTGTNSLANGTAVQDPFTSTIHALGPVGTVGGRKLSPMAEVYTPSLSNVGPFRQSRGGSGIQYLNATSLPEDDGSTPNASQSLLSAPPRYLLPGTIGQHLQLGTASAQGTPLQGSTNGFSSSGLTSRYLQVFGVQKTVTQAQLDAVFHDPSFSLPHVVVTTRLSSEGTIYVKFLDLRDAQAAHSRLKESQASWSVRFVGAKDFAKNYNPGDQSQVSDFEGQIMLTVHINNEDRHDRADELHTSLTTILASIGDVLAHEPSSAAARRLTIRVEFYVASHADLAVQKLNGISVAGMRLEVSLYTPDLVKDNPPTCPSRPIIVSANEADLSPAMGGLRISSQYPGTTVNNALTSSAVITPQRVPRGMSETQQLMTTPITSPMSAGGSSSFFFAGPGPQPEFYMTPHTSPMAGSPNLPMNFPVYGNFPAAAPRYGAMMHRNGSNQRPSPSSIRRYNDYSSGSHNVVDVGRIQAGLDVRTTIMLRNIPNKVDQAALKELVDTTSRGKYDFMYLRIDFANNCNVGYAFINFEDPYYIVDFVRTRAGNRWDQFNSDKVAEVSYATIQGKDCLVQKFRNSSVMLESPSFRPKIFRTGDGPDAGTEDVFPKPDNPSKMRRSIENAEHVGLFAPRLGQQFRDEQRRRRSQYDRGTRLAEIEDTFNFPGPARHDSIRPQNFMPLFGQPPAFQGDAPY